MKLSEIQRRAVAIIEPQNVRIKNEFARALADAVLEHGVPEWRKDRNLERLATKYVRDRIRLVYLVLGEVVSTTHSMVSEYGLRASFTALCPTLDVMRTEVYARFVGYNVGVSPSLACEFDSAYQGEEKIAIETLALLAHDISLPGLFKDRKIVFISCGQCTHHERSLGSEIARRITERTEYEGYFAQNEQTLESVTTHILAALAACVGFVAVIHKRGEVSGPDGQTFRGSVWVEQEIGLVSYRVQVLGHSVAVLTYVQEGVALEGVRQVLLLNSRPFQTNEDILADLTQRLSDGSFLGVDSRP